MFGEEEAVSGAAWQLCDGAMVCGTAVFKCLLQARRPRKHAKLNMEGSQGKEQQEQRATGRGATANALSNPRNFKHGTENWFNF